MIAWMESLQFAVKQNFSLAATTQYNRQQLRDMVYRIRTMEHGTWEHAVRSHPLRSVSADDPRAFMRFFADVVIDKTGDLTRMLGFGHPDLMFELKHGPCPLFFDGTFRIVPSGFYQLFTIMMYSKAYDMYFPVFFILLQGKHEVSQY